MRHWALDGRKGQRGGDVCCGWKRIWARPVPQQDLPEVSVGLCKREKRTCDPDSLSQPLRATMGESAEVVAANLKSRRNVTIEITNLTNNYCLIDPKVYLESGNVHSPPQPTIRPLKTEVCNFSKTSAKATGAVGVLTYDLFERQSNCAKETLAIMFSVPYDCNLYKNWLAIGIFSQGKAVNESLYKEMYYNKEEGFVRQEANGSGLTFEGNVLDIKATMSPLGRAILKVEVWDKLFCPIGQQQH
ncbi:DELTA-sagatoxin-Srs1a-like [Mugil cephalus]|uniref:DELTA-sagatoxin-Srs1a-like n=1 Tax=Mugil cephalus TaxID=48193 RepID=UPI001FB611A2|nr:DELTA-sagatoxin-Srs1a-like [Mugil cephalus]